MHVGMGGIEGIILVLLWLGFAAGGVIGWVIFLVAVWRTMRAHESIADSVKEAVEILTAKQGTR